MWKEFDASTPAHLMHLAYKVKETVLASKAQGTIRTYLGGYNRWKRWASSNGVSPVPASPFHVAIYLQLLSQEACSPSPILTAVYSIDWVHQLAGYSRLSGHPLVESMKNGCERLLARPKNRKEPISAEMLHCLALKFQDKCSVCDLRTFALCLIGYAGFLRFNELCSIRCCDVHFFPTYCSIFLECSKTDQLREGSWVSIARTGQVTCPVMALEKYILAAGLCLDDDLPLFRALASGSSSCKVRPQGISYTRARELVKDAFRDITDVSKISLHSLRSGGASAAANAGIPDRLFKRHGRWSSENAKDVYVKDSLESRLSVSRALGI